MKFSSRVLIINVSFIFFLHCGQPDISQKISKDGLVKIEGRFLKDSIYDGLVRFYNAHNNKLIMEANYIAGVQQGNYKKYHENGKIALETGYANDTRNGYVFVYNQNGYLIKKQYMYYGLKVGSSVTYDMLGIKHYSFYSFDNDLLFDLSYDSVGSRKITDIISGYFFLFDREFIQILGQESKVNHEIFLYTPNPPKYNFEYSLVILKTDSEVKQVVETFDNSKMWSTFVITNPNDIYAIRLIIKDSLANDHATMFKKLQ